MRACAEPASAAVAGIALARVPEHQSDRARMVLEGQAMESETAALLIGLALVLGALITWLLMRRQRSTALRERFGPEYDRTVRSAGDPHRAEAELEARKQRVEQLRIRALSAEERGRFAEVWRSVQTRFVDHPGAAIRDADRLVAEVMRARGYPVGDFEQGAADVSVDHPDVVENYRAAHALATRQERDEASTEDLRQAMVHYRALFDDLLDARSEPRHRAA
jgi:hypothetical protein